MLWLLLASLTALSDSLKDVFSKHGLKSIDEYVVAWALRLIAFLCLLPLLLFIPIPEIKPLYWLALLVSGGLNVATTVIYMKALKYSDLSLSVPFISFSPMFLLITSPIILGEYPNWIGFIGVMLIVFGSYTMNLQSLSSGWLTPFKSLFENVGSRYMLGVALVWSITANFDKIGIQNSSPIFWAISVTGTMALFLFPVVMVKSKDSLGSFKTRIINLLPIGFFSALTLAFQMSALKLTLVAYVLSIKRTSGVLAVLWGALIFKETNIRQRVIGSAIMVAGVVCITLS